MPVPVGGITDVAGDDGGNGGTDVFFGRVHNISWGDAAGRAEVAAQQVNAHVSLHRVADPNPLGGQSLQSVDASNADDRLVVAKLGGRLLVSGMQVGTPGPEFLVSFKASVLLGYLVLSFKGLLASVRDSGGAAHG